MRCAGGFVAMTCNYTLNRFWTFRAREIPLVPSYLKYVAGAVGALAVKLGVMAALPGMSYNASNLIGIVAQADTTSAMFFATSPSASEARRPSSDDRPKVSSAHAASGWPTTDFRSGAGEDASTAARSASGVAGTAIAVLTTIGTNIVTKLTSVANAL